MECNVTVTSESWTTLSTIPPLAMDIAAEALEEGDPSPPKKKIKKIQNTWAWGEKFLPEPITLSIIVG